MIKTQHCPNCEATEQKLHDFRQEVSHNVRLYREEQPYIWKQSASGYFSHLIIPAPKPDPLVEALTKAGWGMPEINAKELRAALGAVGFEIREKNDG
jgi:hypothetical protein